MLSSKVISKNIISDLDELKDLLKYKKSAIKNFSFFYDTSFADDIWDFSQLNKNNRESSKYKFNFKNIKFEYRDYVKIVILEAIVFSHNRIQTINKDFEILGTITNEFVISGIISPEFINNLNIKKFIEEKEKQVKWGYLGRYLLPMINLVKLIYFMNQKDETKILNYLNEKKKECNSHKATKSKNDYIPDEFLDAVVSIAVKESLRNDIPKTEQIFACLIIILAETGMRREELCLLETNKLEEIEIGEKKVSYLNFITTKTANSTEEKRDTYCYLSDLGVSAYKRAEGLVYDLIDNMSDKVRLNIYLDIIKNNQLEIEINDVKDKLIDGKLKSDGSNLLDKYAKKYLFISDHTKKKILHTSSLRDYLMRFTIRNYEELMKVAPKYEDEISYFKVESKTGFEKFFGRGKDQNMEIDEVKDIEFPYVNFHRFRVTVCTKLYEKGIPIDYIRMHMNHLYEDMTIYYIQSDRNLDQLEENIEDIQLIMDKEGYISSEISESDIDIIEIDKKIRKINAFLKKNKINVKSDLGVILELIKKKNGTVVENEFGICIKSLISGICQKRKYFNREKNIYGIGLELETFKYIHLNYERFVQKVEIIKHNERVVEENEEFKFELEREKKSLKYFVNKTLFREIKLLKNEVEKIGEINFVEKYKNLKEIIENLESIEKEVTRWS